MRQLFFVGNKRSGTSQLVRLLNLHPRIHVTHESDIAWILLQFHNHRPFKPHPWDSSRGMNLTLETADNLLQQTATPAQNFLTLQTQVMRHGNPWMPPQNKTEGRGLLWLGDKKPQQQTDPELLEFVLQHFPEARFIHIVRHPFEVIDSSDRFNKTDQGDFWLGMSPGQKLERWAFHEQQVFKLREALAGRILSLRYEDLCRHTRRELLRVFHFLDVDPLPTLLRKAAHLTRPLYRPVKIIPASAHIRQVATSYGYDLDQSPARLASLFNISFWRVAKFLGVV